MGIIRRWHGTESEEVTRRKLKKGDIVRSFGGTFAARMGPIGGILERCLAINTWETKYRTIDEYVASLHEKVS